MLRSNYFLLCVPLVLSMFLPHTASAAVLTFQVIPNTEVGDTTTLLEVRIDPQSKSLNVVEGEIQFSGTASDNLSVQVENGQSILPLWPTPPEYDIDKKSISFIGGVPSGFDSEGLLFRLRLATTVAGTLAISYVNGNAYLNDGKGTSESVSSKSLDITLDADAHNKINETSFNVTTNTYVIIIVSVIVVLLCIFKFGLRKNVK